MAEKKEETLQGGFGDAQLPRIVVSGGDEHQDKLLTSEKLLSRSATQTTLQQSDPSFQQQKKVLEADAPILSLARACSQLLDRCLHDDTNNENSSAAPRLLKWKRRFCAWLSYLDVFAERRINLDRRLRKKPRIQDIVLRLLLILQQSLDQWSKISERYEKNEVKGDKKDVSDPWSEAIEEALQELSHVGIAIQQSPKISETAQARRALSDRRELPHYEILCYLALETLYPSAPETLIRQICESMVSRFARHLYRNPERPRPEVEAEKRKSPLRTPQSQSKVPQTGIKESIIGLDKSPSPIRNFIEYPNTIVSIDSKAFERNLNVSRTPMSRSPSSVARGRMLGPPIPVFDHVGQAKCQWCFRMIEKDLVQDGRWSSEGIGHYEKDLLPFFCVSELCSGKETNFATRRAWQSHMSKHHPRWPALIHRQKLWNCKLEMSDPNIIHSEPYEKCRACTSDHTHDTVAYFTSKSHFMSHVQTIHPPTKQIDCMDGQPVNMAKWTDEELLDLANDSIIDISLDPDVCPICRLTPEELATSGANSMMDHVAQHLQFIMLLSLRLTAISGEHLDEEEGDEDSGFAVVGESVSRDSREVDESAKRQRTPDSPLSPFQSPIIQPTPALPEEDTKELLVECYDIADIRQKVFELDPFQESDMDRHLLTLVQNQKRTPELTIDKSKAAFFKFRDSFLQKISEASITSSFDNLQRKYLPHGLLEELVTVKTTEEGLMSTLSLEQDDKEMESMYRTFNNPICDWLTTEAKAVFAITIDCDLEPEQLIQAFANFQLEGLSDRRLPIEDPTKNYPWSKAFDREIWARHNMRTFYEKQWQYLAPVFSITQFDFKFADDIILPMTGDMNDSSKGGFSLVRKVHIHPNHWDGPTAQPIALKEIILTSGVDASAVWEQEVRMMKLVSQLDHNHIIQCFGSMQLGTRCLMMFPWADGQTLGTFWAERQFDLQSDVQAILNQLRGLADALDTMHNFESQSDAEESITHGDLKPDNILRFLAPGSDIGTLKIADLAFSEHHLEATKYRSGGSISRYVTVFYGAPELELGSQPRSRSSDLWSMGCIIFEFIIWILYGYKELVAFYVELGGSSGARRYYEVVERDRISVHSVVMRWMSHIEVYDPEFARKSAVADLMEFVKKRLLVVPRHQRVQAVGSTLLRRSPRVRTVDSALLRDSDDSDAEEGLDDFSFRESAHRATAGELLDKLDDILENDGGNEHFFSILDSDRVILPSEAREINSRPPNSGNVIHGKPDAYYSIPALMTWEYRSDKSFSGKVLEHVGKDAFSPSPYISNLEICKKCLDLDFSAHGFTLRWRREDLETDAHSCPLCRMVFEKFNRLQKDASICQLERFGSNLKFTDTASPAFSLVRSPEWGAETPIQLGFVGLPNPKSRTFYDILLLWLEDCELNHEGCQRTPHERLPKRLIDVGTAGSSTIRLVETGSEQVKDYRFIALSHSWGSSDYQRFVTRSDNLKNFKKSIRYDQLPQTFQDAVDCTRALEIRYLWIDAICIVFGDDGDFREETLRMEDVFGGAYCVIAANRSTSQIGGFLGPRQQRKYVKMKDPFYVCEFIDDFDKDVLESHLSQRAWVLQERALARRTLYFGEGQTYFECGEGIRCETLTKMRSAMTDVLGDPHFPAKAMSATGSTVQKILFIQSIYRQYSRLHMSFTGDRAVAIRAIEQRLLQGLKVRGGYGILDYDLATFASDIRTQGVSGTFCRSMLWQRGQQIGDVELLTPIPYAVIDVPSWSWMAYMGGIDYMDIPYGDVDWELDIQSEDERPGNVTSDRYLDFPIHIWGPIRIITFCVKEDADNLEVIYDALSNRPNGYLQACVVLGVSKRVITEGIPDKTCYVLLVDEVVLPDSKDENKQLEFIGGQFTKLPNDPVPFQRVGVGCVPESHLIGDLGYGYIC